VSNDKGAIMATIEQVTNNTAAIEALAIRFATLQAEHAQRSDGDAKQRSRDAIRSWGERVPAALTDKPRTR
jgi:aspartokinase